MSVLQNLQPVEVFKYFEQISAIPRGSGNMVGISTYCMNFAKEHSLRAVCDKTKNVVIYKDATDGFEKSRPVILQGHLDMVCQKTAESDIDFEKDGIRLVLKGDAVSADGTTLGADNGIAVAMILAVLASSDIPHPPLEAVFTVDEEIGMLGAAALDTSILRGRRMINIDSEEEAFMTVSCAGGSDFRATLPVIRKRAEGAALKITLKNLRGGHSGICINEGRVNASLLAGRFLKELDKSTQVDIISINGGDKTNAIPDRCEIILASAYAELCEEVSRDILSALANEISSREPNFAFDIESIGNGSYDVLCDVAKKSLVYALVCTPNGVVDMSADIDNLVETSLNLGILRTTAGGIDFCYSLRSNKKVSLLYLEDKMSEFYKFLNAKTIVSGQYPPWEYRRDSVLQKVYKKAYAAALCREPKAEAIHAGLECAVFADKIQDLDCIAIGPDVFDAHTTDEHLSVSSVSRIYTVLKEVLKKIR